MNLAAIVELVKAHDSAGLKRLFSEDSFWRSEVGRSKYLAIGGTMSDEGLHENVLFFIERLRSASVPIDKESDKRLRHLAADSLLQSGRYPEAIATYDALLQEDTDDPVAHANKALASWENGDYENGLKHYVEASRLDPDNPTVFRGIGEMLNRLGRYREAIEPLRRAVMLRPGYAKAYKALGVAYYNSEDWLEAYRALKTARKLDPSDDVASLGVRKLEDHFEL